MIDGAVDIWLFLCIKAFLALLLFVVVKVGIPRFRYSLKDIKDTGLNRRERRKLTNSLKKNSRIRKK